MVLLRSKTFAKKVAHVRKANVCALDLSHKGAGGGGGGGGGSLLVVASPSNRDFPQFRQRRLKNSRKKSTQAKAACARALDR